MDRGPHFRVPRFLTVVHHSPDVVEFRQGVWNATSHVIRDEGRAGRLSEVVRLLDGSRTTAEVARAVGIGRPEVESVVDHLLGQGLLETSARSYIDRLVDMLGDVRVDGSILPTGMEVLGDGLAQRVADLMHETDPHIDISVNGLATKALGELVSDDAWLADGLESARALAPFAGWTGRFVVLAESLVDPQRARVVNRASLEHRLPCLYVAVDGPAVLVVPLVLPGLSACWECFETRIVMNLRDSASYLAYKDALLRRQVDGSGDPIPAVAALAASLASTEALSFMATGEAVTVGHAWSIFLPTMELANHEVLRVPGCPACGSSPERDDSELYFDLRALVRE